MAEQRFTASYLTKEGFEAGCRDDSFYADLAEYSEVHGDYLKAVIDEACSKNWLDQEECYAICLEEKNEVSGHWFPVQWYDVDANLLYVA